MERNSPRSVHTAPKESITFDLQKWSTDSRRATAAQIDGLRRDLALVKRQIEFERERRAELERLAAVEYRESQTPEHAAMLQQREDEIRKLKEERAALMEWLRRGVAEAQTISLEVETLRVRVDEAAATHSDLASEKQRLEQMEQRLAQEMTEATTSINRLSEAASVLEGRLEHRQSLIAITKDMSRSAAVDRERLEEDVESLQRRARNIESIELAVGCMSASVRRAQHDLEKLQEQLAAGTLADNDTPEEDDGYDSEQDADPTRSAPVVLNSTKAKVGRCEALLLTIRSMLHRYNQDEDLKWQRREEELAALHRTMSEEAAQTKRRYMEEVNILQSVVESREAQLRFVTRLRNQAIASQKQIAVGGELSPDLPPIRLTDYYDVELSQIRGEAERIRSDNALLEENNRLAEKDYAAVKQLKHEYRDLEARKLKISQDLRDMEEENRLLKFDLFDREPPHAAASHAPTQRPPWRSPTVR